MKTGKIILTIVFVWLFSVPVLAEQDILSSIPQDAFGFVAAKSPQALFDNLCEIVPPLKDLDKSDDPVALIKEHLGDVNLNAPVVLVILPFERFADLDDDRPPIALLFSAADPQAVIEAHKAKVDDQPSESQDLPPGLTRIEDGYMGVKNGFIVFAPTSDSAAALLAGQGSFEVPIEVRKAYRDGRIVAYSPLKRIVPLFADQIDEFRGKMIEEADDEIDFPPALVALYVDSLLSILEQAEEIIGVASIDDESINGTGKVIFQPDSSVARFINDSISDQEPSYRHLPAGTFIWAGAVRSDPQVPREFIDDIIERAKAYPELEEQLADENVQTALSEIKAFSSQFSGFAAVANIGSPGTGMLSLVARFDVADPATFLTQIKRVCEEYINPQLAEHAGLRIIYTQAAETFVGVPIDTLRLEIIPEAERTSYPELDDDIVNFLPMLLGPDLTVRLASPNDDEVFLIVGGGFERAERVINVAQGFGSSLDKHPLITNALAKLPPHRLYEQHFHVGQFLAAIQTLVPNLRFSEDRSGPPPSLMDLPLITSCDSVEPDTFRRDIIIPAEAVTTVAKLLVPPIAAARGAAAAAVCMSNIHSLDQCLTLYAASYDDQYPNPAQWREILIEEDFATPEMFICPSNKNAAEDANDYVFVPWPNADVEGGMLVIFERQAVHKGKRNVVTGGHSTMRVDEAQFQTMLAQTIEALNARGIEFTWEE